MDFKAWKDRVWKASTRIKAYLKVFFSKLLKGKLGKNTLHGPDALSEASHQMLCTEASLSSTARSMGLAHTTLTRKLQRVSRDEVWAALSSVMDSMLGVKENLLIADFTPLEYTGKELLSLTTRSARGQLRHIALAIRAFIRLEWHRLRTGLSWYEAKTGIIREAIRTYLANPTFTLTPTA